MSLLFGLDTKILKQVADVLQMRYVRQLFEAITPIEEVLVIPALTKTVGALSALANTGSAALQSLAQLSITKGFSLVNGLLPKPTLQHLLCSRQVPCSYAPKLAHKGCAEASTMPTSFDDCSYQGTSHIYPDCPHS